MDREQRNVLQNYTVAMRQRLRELDEYGNTDKTLQTLKQLEGLVKTLQTLKQLEGLARNARDKIGNLEAHGHYIVPLATRLLAARKEIAELKRDNEHAYNAWREPTEGRP